MSDRKIVLYRGGKNVEVKITYAIFDPSNSLLSDPFETYAKNGRHALEIYLKSKGRKEKVKRTGGQDSHYNVTSFFYDDGTRYRHGRSCWYSSAPQPITLT